MWLSSSLSGVAPYEGGHGEARLLLRPACRFDRCCRPNVAELARVLSMSFGRSSPLPGGSVSSLGHWGGKAAIAAGTTVASSVPFGEMHCDFETVVYPDLEIPGTSEVVPEKDCGRGVPCCRFFPDS